MDWTTRINLTRINIYCAISVYYAFLRVFVVFVCYFCYTYSM